MTRSCISALAASAACLALLPAGAAAKVHLRLKPSAPRANDAVTVVWRADRTLKPGYHFEANLVTKKTGHCAGLAYKESHRHPKRGDVVTFRLRPRDDDIALDDYGSKVHWCTGEAFIIVTYRKDSDPPSKKSRTVGSINFRFRAAA